MALTEVAEQRQLRRRGLSDWHGVRTFTCTAAEAIPGAATLYGQPFPGGSGVGWPKCYDYNIIYAPYPEGIKGTALVLAYYNTPGITILPAGMATLEMKFSEKIVKRTSDPVTGKLIEGQELSSDGDHTQGYDVVGGTNYIGESEVVYVINAWFRRSELPSAAIAACKNKLNNIAFTKPKAARGELRMVGAETTEGAVSENARVSIVLAHQEGGWDESITVRPYTIQLRKRYIYDALGVATTEPRSVQTKIYNTKWVVRKKITVPVHADDEARGTYKYGNFNWMKQITIVDTPKTNFRGLGLR